MAWSTRLASGRRLRHDLAADADKNPHCLYADRGPSARVYRYNSGPSDGTEQNRAWGRVSGFQRWVLRGIGEGVVLGRVDFPAADLCW